MTFVNESMTDGEINQILNDFSQKHESPLSNLAIGKDDINFMWQILEVILSNPERTKCHLASLKTMKIFARNKLLVKDVVTKSTLETLLGHAGIAEKGQQSTREDVQSRDITVIEEAQRCLSNIMLQKAESHEEHCLDDAMLPGIFNQMTKYETYRVPLEVIGFDMRLLFLISAYDEKARDLALFKFDGTKKLLEIMHYVIRLTKNRMVGKVPGSLVLNQSEVYATNDILKVFFNFTCQLQMPVPAQGDHSERDEPALRQLDEMAKCVHLVMTVGKETLVMERSITSNCINLLTNFPVMSLKNVLSPLSKELIEDANDKEITFQGMCMNVPKAFLDHLLYNLKHALNSCNSNSLLRELATPNLKVLCSLAAGYPAVRKYYRASILPPLKNVNERPEEGDSTRNVLCRFLTSPESSVNIMVAEFLFTLCKENVKRMVKYTGYGNAAGLLARRGLMFGGYGTNAANYSDEESDSDTEEYIKNVDKVNPITGCAEPIKPSPLEGMSDEQKEYEAVKLANLIDRLHNIGVVKPAKVGKDGNPTAVEHILELVDDHSNTIQGLHRTQDSKDCDSD